MKKTLVILAHPNFEHSIANKKIISELEKNIENIEVRDIHALYPDYKIDVEAEQKALLESDNVIFQYPFYWYNMPAILKKWFDDVFTYGFAYGAGGDKLKGKNFQLSFTVGAKEEAYSPLGSNHFKVDRFLIPMEQTAYLTKMEFQKPMYAFGCVYVKDVYNSPEEVEKNAAEYSVRLLEKINSYK
ncbi:NAD(P)H-dependent oxidoreductase [Flammeovirga sp. SubArs3]|uniref:NAD(P)H-dependent oxidoreductase n=1 Tax=Flammeovirga sp. SubArs3 TaxID=2995316 RepID=UPI00248D2D29|nr:NAD(P)H-dependent oxidoreductase [Flammeovirga sp. SubArs3]